MTAFDVSLTVLCFFSYGLAGWLAEGTVALYQRRWFANPGFLRGPVVPIYGVGALLILGVTQPVAQNPAMVFIVGVAVATAVEYVTHWALEQFFGLVLWDYTGHLGNIHGRVCLANSLAFGVGGLLVVFVFDPWLRMWLGGMGVVALVSAASALGALFVVDLTHSVVAVVSPRPEFQAAKATLGEVRAQLELHLDEFSESLEGRRRRQYVRRLRRTSEALDRLQRAFPTAHVSVPLRRRRPRQPLPVSDAQDKQIKRSS